MRLVRHFATILFEITRKARNLHRSPVLCTYNAFFVRPDFSSAPRGRPLPRTPLQTKLQLFQRRPAPHTSSLFWGHGRQYRYANEDLASLAGELNEGFWMLQFDPADIGVSCSPAALLPELRCNFLPFPYVINSESFYTFGYFCMVCCMEMTLLTLWCTALCTPLLMHIMGQNWPAFISQIISC